jgi:hypothetical protein
MEHYFMKSRTMANFATVAALAAILPLGISNAHAVSAPAAPVAADAVVQTSQLQRVEWKEEKREKLRHAYWLMEHADGDYSGHRVAAMEHMKKLGEMLGIELHGKDYAHTDQFKSDERLRRARALLHEIAEDSGPKEVEHIHKAVGEIDRALDVK